MKEVLRFTASWCGPCKMLAKTLDGMELNANIEVIDIDEKPDLAVEYMVRGVPTLVMKDNKDSRLVGAKSAKEIEDWINA